MASESELIARLQEFLRSSDLKKTTTTIVRRRLEEDFGVDLSEKKAFLREQVTIFLQNLQDSDEEYDRTVVDESGDINGSDSKQEEESRKRKRQRRRPINKLPNEVKKKAGGFCTVSPLSPQLQEFIGSPEMARSEVVKQIWNYIREKNLQDPKDRRNIICDESLRVLFDVDSINMFDMNKALSKHILRVDSHNGIVGPSTSTKKAKQPKQETQERDRPECEKIQERGKWGFLAPLQLSESLVNFLVTGEKALPRSDVIKKIWDHIKQNNLQDPEDRKRVICDAKLRELFGVESFVGFTLSKLLNPHFIKKPKHKTKRRIVHSEL